MHATESVRNAKKKRHLMWSVQAEEVAAAVEEEEEERWAQIVT
jgi:hypothetical protein